MREGCASAGGATRPGRRARRPASSFSLPCGDAVHLQRLADDVARRHARVQRRERVLEDDLHLPPVGPQRGFAQPGDVLAVELDRAAGRLDQAQHGARHGRLAAAALADQAQGLAFADRKADAVDRIDMPGGAPQQPLLDREMLFQVVDLEHRRAVVAGAGAAATSRTGTLRHPAPAIKPLRVPAGRPMARPLLLVGRKLTTAAVVGEGAARRERAAGRQVGQRRHHAGDFLQPLSADIGGSRRP